MIINESFYIAISFVFLIVILYPRIKNYFNQYLQNSILSLTKKIDDAKKTNLENKVILFDAQKKVSEFIKIKNEKILFAKENSIKIRADYVSYVSAILDQKNKTFNLYLLNSKSKFLKDSRSQIIKSASKVVEEIIKNEHFHISNKLN